MSEENATYNELKRRIVTSMNAWNLMEGDLPSARSLMEEYYLNLADFKTVCTEIDEAIENRVGISPLAYYETVFNPVISLKPVTEKSVGAKELDPVFILACNVILASTDKRTTAAKLRSIDVSPAKWEAFLRKKNYRDFFEKALADTFDRAESGAKLALIRNIESGDLGSIKHYQEYTGRFKPNAEVTMNLGIILGKLMEILSKKLGPEDLVEVADAIDLLVASPKELTA